MANEPAATNRQQAPTGEGEIVLIYVKNKLNAMIDIYSHDEKPFLDPANLKNLYYDLQARAEMGLKKYGTYLRTDNGRSAQLDLYQELMDAVMYSAQALMEGKEAGVLFELLINIASQTAARVNREIDANQESR